MNSKYWLEAKDVTAIKNGYEVIKDLSLKLKNGERTIILGPNGSGKSSIVDLINRNIYPLIKTNSQFKLFDKEQIDIWELRQKISTVNNEIKSRINPNLKIYDLIVSGLHGKYCKVKNINFNDKNLTKAIIQRMSLNSIADKCFGYLSDGEKQIALIARALINKPEILILDEPITNLDLKSKYFLIDKIHELSYLNLNIICITHDISVISKAFTRIILIKDRKIIKDGKPIEIMNSTNINSLFDTNIKLIENNEGWDILRY